MDVVLISNKLLKPTIISISMATVMAGAAISPALGLIAKAFPDASPTLIKLVLTSPSLMIIPFSFISSYLTTKFHKRSIVLFALVIFLVGGVGPQFMPTIETLIAFRLILGIGVGLLMPLSESLINDYYEGRERTKMMGYNSAFSNFGGIITMLLAGMLATFGWRLPFNVYFIGLFIFVLIFFYLPKGEIQKPPQHKERAKTPLIVFGYSIAMSAIMLAYYAIATNMAIFLEQNNIGGAGIAGIIVSFSTVGGMITSLLLVQIEMTLKRIVIPFMLFLMGIAFLFLTFTSNIPLIMISVSLIGFAQGTLFPIITIKTIDAVDYYLVDRAIAIASSFIFLGQFLSPLVLDGIGALFNNSTIRFQYGVLSGSILIATMLLFIYIFKPKKQSI